MTTYSQVTEINNAQSWPKICLSYLLPPITKFYFIFKIQGLQSWSSKQPHRDSKKDNCVTCLKKRINYCVRQDFIIVQNTSIKGKSDHLWNPTQFLLKILYNIFQRSFFLALIHLVLAENFGKKFGSRSNFDRTVSVQSKPKK